MVPNWFATNWWGAYWNYELGAPGGGEPIIATKRYRIWGLGLGLGLIQPEDAPAST